MDPELLGVKRARADDELFPSVPLHLGLEADESRDVYNLTYLESVYGKHIVRSLDRAQEAGQLYSPQPRSTVTAKQEQRKRRTRDAFTTSPQRTSGSRLPHDPSEIARDLEQRLHEVERKASRMADDQAALIKQAVDPQRRPGSIPANARTPSDGINRNPDSPEVAALEAQLGDQSGLSLDMVSSKRMLEMEVEELRRDIAKVSRVMQLKPEAHGLTEATADVRKPAPTRSPVFGRSPAPLVPVSSIQAATKVPGPGRRASSARLFQRAELNGQVVQRAGPGVGRCSRRSVEDGSRKVSPNGFSRVSPRARWARASCEGGGSPQATPHIEQGLPRTPSAMDQGSAVRVVGMGALHGRGGIIDSWDRHSGRWCVVLEDGTGLALRPEDLEVSSGERRGVCSGARVRVHGLQESSEFNGQAGTAVEWDPAHGGRWKVCLDGGQRKIFWPENLHVLPRPCSALVSGPCRITPGSRVRVCGDAPRGVRGRIGLVVDWDFNQARWRVEFADGSDHFFGTSHLEVLDEDEGGECTRMLLPPRRALEQKGGPPCAAARDLSPEMYTDENITPRHLVARGANTVLRKPTPCTDAMSVIAPPAWAGAARADSEHPPRWRPYPPDDRLANGASPLRHLDDLAELATSRAQRRILSPPRPQQRHQQQPAAARSQAAMQQQQPFRGGACTAAKAAAPSMDRTQRPWHPWRTLQVAVDKRVRAVGLLVAEELNGQVGTVKDWDDAQGRWRVIMDDGAGRLFFPDNLEVVDDGDESRPPTPPTSTQIYPACRVYVSGLQHRTELNGDTGTALFFEPEEKRWNVRMDAGGMKKFFPENLRRLCVDVSRDHPQEDLLVAPGKWVRVQALQRKPELNGCYGMATGWDLAHGRWHVRMDDGSEKLLRPENVKVPADALGLKCFN